MPRGSRSPDGADTPSKSTIAAPPVASDWTVTALVCTRDRPESLLRAVRSLLAGSDDGILLELIVVDQSQGPESERTLAALSSDARLRYVRAPSTGAGSALNTGLALTQGSILACIDDDCEAPPGWISEMRRALHDQPTAAIVFCNVVAGPHDPNAGFVPCFERRRSRLVHSIAATCLGHGMSAGMVLRRDILVAIGGFDDALGPGSRFPAGDDWDITFRALLNGWDVYETAEVSVIHYGFRSFAEGRAHTRRNWLGIGAVCSKLLRTRRLSALTVPVWDFSVHALWPPVFDLLRLRRPRGLIGILSFFEGLVQGLRTPMDRKTLLFIESNLKSSAKEQISLI